MDVVPVALVVLAPGVELAHQAVGHLAGDVGGHLLHVAVVLQEGARHVQRQVGAVDAALQQHQKLRNDLLDVVGHEHLVVVELDHALAGGELVLELGEVEDALQVKGILGVQVNPEQRIVHVVEHAVVEFLILLVGALVGALHPQRVRLVDLLRIALLLHLGDFLGRGLGDFSGLGGFGFLAVLLFCFGLLVLDLGQEHRNRHERAVLLQRGAQRPQVQEVLVLLGDVQRDAGAALGAVAFLQIVLHAVLAGPAHGGFALDVALGFDLHLVGDHEAAVEAQAEVADDAAALAVLLIARVLLHKVRRTGEGHLGDVLHDLVAGHAKAVVDELDRSGLRVGDHVHAVFGVLLDLRFATVHKPLQLADRVTAVGHQFADKDVFIGIQPLLDDGHDVFCIDGYGSLSKHVGFTSRFL